MAVFDASEVQAFSSTGIEAGLNSHCIIIDTGSDVVEGAEIAY